jgi:hypothetical protein
MKLTGLFVLACTLHSQETPAGRVYSAKPPAASTTSSRENEESTRSAERLLRPTGTLFWQHASESGAQPIRPPAAGDDWYEQRVADYLPRNVVRSYIDNETTRVNDLAPLISELSAHVPGRFRQFKPGDRLVHEVFTTVLREDELHRYEHRREIRMSIASSAREAERSFAAHLAYLPVCIPARDLSRTRFGEASWDNGRSRRLVFIRRNVLVRFYYDAFIVDKNTRRVKEWNDPDLQLKAEALARRIDDLILLNPR